MNVEARVKASKEAKRDTDKVMNWDLFLDPTYMKTFEKFLILIN